VPCCSARCPPNPFGSARIRPISRVRPPRGPDDRFRPARAFDSGDRVRDARVVPPVGARPRSAISVAQLGSLRPQERNWDGKRSRQTRINALQVRGSGTGTGNGHGKHA
jgi:hypothetical protein